MFELLAIVIFAWLMFKCIGFALKLTWGAATIIASILMVLALPALILCLVFVGGFFLLVPVAMIVIAAVILRACIS